MQSLNLDLLNKMTTSLVQNKTITNLQLDYNGIQQKEDANPFTYHLLLGLAENTTLTDLTLSLLRECWDWLREGEWSDIFK